MDEPVQPRQARGWALKEVSREDLELYGIGELEDRIADLEAEIARTRAQISKNASGRAAAEALFSFKGGDS